jgi:hypothetical protein
MAQRMRDARLKIDNGHVRGSIPASRYLRVRKGQPGPGIVPELS